MQNPDKRKWAELNKMMGRSAERDAILDYLSKLETVPKNAEEFLTHLKGVVDEHQALFAKNRLQWREQFFKYLPARQVKKAIERGLVRKSGYKELLESLSVAKANVTANWGFKEFWQKSLSTSCCCGCTSLELGSVPELKKIKYNCPPVTPEENDELLQGRSKEAVRHFVLRSSLYRNMKLMLKHKNFKENKLL